MATDFVVGNIVQVINRDSYLEPQQGQVVAVDEEGEKTIHVWFGRECNQIIHSYLERSWDELTVDIGKEPEFVGDPRKSIRVVAFAPGELSLCPDGWNQERFATRYFRDALVYQKRSTPFVAGPNVFCEVEGCSNLAVRRIVVNIWSCVYTPDVCDKCAQKYHGQQVPSFPWKKKVSA